LFWLVVPVLPVLLLLLFGLGPLVDQQSENPVQHEMYSAYADWLTIAAAIWLAGTAAALYGIRHEKVAYGLTVLALASLLAAQIGITGYNTIARERSGYPIAEAITKQIKPDVPFYSIQNYEQTLPFYLKRTFILVDFKDEMAFGIEQEPHKWIADIATFTQRWNSDKEAYAIMPLRVLPELEQKGLSMKEIYRDHQLVVVVKP
jgi:hypothetical protein